jgi:hypothetical protein
MKYFHELSKQELNELIDKKRSTGYIMKHYKQPDWCLYPKALSWQLGCWSLCTTDYPSVICKEYCKTCEYYYNKK